MSKWGVGSEAVPVPPPPHIQVTHVVMRGEGSPLSDNLEHSDSTEESLGLSLFIFCSYLLFSQMKLFVIAHHLCAAVCVCPEFTKKEVC